jgi:hypothetical protein
VHLAHGFGFEVLSLRLKARRVMAMTHLQRLVLVVLWLTASTHSFAARPFVTDDARMTNAESCQLESWSRAYKTSNEFWVLPACNFTGGFEVTAGAGTATHLGQAATKDFVLQGKTLFRELTTNGWGWGLAVGKVSHPDIAPGPNLLGNTYAYIPVSCSTHNDKVIFHTNVGWLKDKATSENRATWGGGAELQATPRILLITESFGDNKNNPYWQLGARYSVVPNFFQIDATTGRQFNGGVETRWISFGLRITPEKLF